MKYVSHGPKETAIIASDLATNVMTKMPYSKHAMVLALIGDLGTGKTSFVQDFAKALGVNERLKSPTFMLIRQYAIPKSSLSLWHLDCYRLESHKDLVHLDLASVLSDSRNIVLIEWPERAKTIFPRDHITVRFSHQGGDKRSITIKWS